MSDKLYLSAQEFLLDSFRLGMQVLASRFVPTFIVAIWRGGTPVGIAVQECLHYYGVSTNHIAIRTSSYQGIDQRSATVRIHDMAYLIDTLCHDDRLLIVDDVFDTGQTISRVLEEIRTRARRNAPQMIRVAATYYKPSRNQTSRAPDYFVRETDKWLKFPHSLEGLSLADIHTHRPALYDIVRKALELTQGYRPPTHHSGPD